MFKKSQLPGGFQGEVLWAVFGVRDAGWCSGNLCAQPEVTILHLGWGLSSCRRAQRYCYVYSMRRNQDPAPLLYYCFLTSSPLFLHLLPSLISSCLNLLFGTQGRSRRLNEAYFLQTRNEDTERICTWESPTGSYSVSILTVKLN